MVELAKKVYLFIFVAFICQKLSFHNGAGGHFGFTPLEKNAGIFARDTGTKYFLKGSRKSNKSSKHLSQKVVMKVMFFTLLYRPINPSMGLNASCFFGEQKKHLPVISPHITPSFIQSHTLASQAVGQHYRLWASNNPLLVQCFVFAVLSYHWTGTRWASVNVGQLWDSDGNLLVYVSIGKVF